MASKKQIAANRANAKNSTGPKTRAGKKRSRGNALKHGLTADHLIIPGEDPDEFEALRKDLTEEFEASSAFQIELVDRLAGLLWRLRRIPALETALVKARQAEDRAKMESDSEQEYAEEVAEEARRRIEEEYANDAQVINSAKLDGTYAIRLGEILDEVETEWIETDDSISNRLKGLDLPSGHESLSMLLKDLENVDPLGKLNRYEVALMKAINRTLQLLHIFQAKRDAAKVITLQAK